jgi:RNA polymerase sigma-70 factor (ECF subfamily)
MLDPVHHPSLDEIVRLGTGENGGDHARELFEEYSPRLARFFGRRGLPEEEIEDLTQETLLRVYRNRRAFMSATEFEAWLFTIAGNVLRNDVRRQRTEKRSGHEVSLTRVEDGTMPEVAADGADPLAQSLQRETRAKVGEALGKLPPQMRLCAVLRYQRGHPHPEIATLTGISPGTVKSHLYQARRKLKGLLSPFYDAAPDEDPL